MNRHTKHSRFGASMMAMVALSAMSGMCNVEAAGTATAENPAGTSAERAPVQYRVLEKSLVGNEIKEAGETAFYAGLPAGNLEPMCDEGRARAAEFIASDKARVARMVENNRDGAAGDPVEFMANLVKVQREMAAEQAANASAQQAAMGDAIGQAVAAGIAQAFATMFPNGIPTAAPAAPALIEKAAAPAPEADKVADTGAAGASDAPTGDAPAKRTRAAS